jgi:hypothetical protein
VIDAIAQMLLVASWEVLWTDFRAVNADATMLTWWAFTDDRRKLTRDLCPEDARSVVPTLAQAIEKAQAARRRGEES